MNPAPIDLPPLAQPAPLWQRPWAGPFALLVFGAVLLALTWQTWPDVLVDFGVQLYVPWRLSAGEVLYRDIAHYTGPLSVYYNALAFKIFGPSLRTLEWANLPILAGIVVAIYYLALRICGKACAFVCGASFLLLFAFSHFSGVGNYNYVCPYEYEYTHGLLLSLGCIIFIWRWARGKSIWNAVAAGFLLGLVFLTRAELFVAALSASLLGMALASISESSTTGDTALSILAFFGCAIIPVLTSVALLSFFMDVRTAIAGVMGMWPALLWGRVTGLLFYRHSMGLDDAVTNLGLMAMWSVLLAIVLGMAALMSIVIKRSSTALAITAAVVVAVLLLLTWKHIAWAAIFRPLPVVCVLVAAGASYSAWRNRRVSDVSSTATLVAMIGMLALVLLGKIILNARIYHYGVWLGMPATMVIVGVAFGYIPGVLKRNGHGAAIYSGIVSVLWASVILVYLWTTPRTLARMNTLAGTGADEFRADSRGIYVQRAIAAIEQLIPPDKTVACLPEGIMINYLSRRRTSTPYVNFNPPDLLLFGEDKMLAAFEKSPPDYVLVIDKDTREFGLPFFGKDYGKKLYGWIAENYQEQSLTLDLGAEPLTNHAFGIRLWVRRNAIG
ncbi:MAG: hypothetical protein M3O30_09490 [Planctomycetota bacterium]|nr:hypothetical protein [Planctomycetota bacterium]